MCVSVTQKGTLISSVLFWGGHYFLCCALLVFFYSISHHGTYENVKGKRKIVRTTTVEKKDIRKNENGVRLPDLALQFDFVKSSIFTIFKNMKARKDANVV